MQKLCHFFPLPKLDFGEEKRDIVNYANAADPKTQENPAAHDF